MSRPPRPPFRVSPSQAQQGYLDALHYLKLEFADFLKLATQLAQDEIGMDVPGGKGDITHTVLELPSLLAHILAAYQNFYAGESFLSTARLTKSLIRHAQRLAYEPDAGLAATGYEVLIIQEGLKGRIPKAFAFASKPLGNEKSQTYETLADLDVKAEWNEMLPTLARKPTEISFTSVGVGIIPLVGVGLDLEVGSYAVLEGQGRAVPLRILSFEESRDRTETLTTVTVPSNIDVVSNPDWGGPILLFGGFWTISTSRIRYQYSSAEKTLTGTFDAQALYAWDEKNYSYNNVPLKVSFNLKIDATGQLEPGTFSITGSIEELGIEEDQILLEGIINTSGIRAESGSGLWMSLLLTIESGVHELGFLPGNECLWNFILTEDSLNREVNNVFTSDWGPIEAALTLISRSTIAKPLLPYDSNLGGYSLLVEPASQFRLFGWNANPIQFPPSELVKPQTYSAPVTENAKGTKKYGYQVVGGSTNLSASLFLATAAEKPLLNQIVLSLDNENIQAYCVTGASTVTLSFSRGEVIEYQIPNYSGSGTSFTVTPASQKEVIETHISDTVTALTLRVPDQAGDVVWSVYPIRSSLLAHWRRALPLAPTRPNPAIATNDLELAASLEGMRPGRTLILSTLDESQLAVAELTSFQQTDRGTTQISWLPANDSWELGNLKIFGNVARISHGETVEEVLGSSDGVSAFQKFPLKKAPVTQTPGVEGGDLNLEIRVNGIAWQRVDDFYEVQSEDRIYRIERSEDQRLTVVFGGEGKGAIPPAGKKNITGVYRIGLGREGNVSKERVSRVKKASPILDRAINLLDIAGGAAPAGLEDMRTQATRHIRSFDRAVSVSDYADLALLFPGVARTTARWTDEAGIELIAATADGIAPEDRQALRKFLDARRDITQPLRLLDPQPIDITVSLLIKNHPAYLSEVVKIAIQNALYAIEDGSPPGLFTFQARELGEAAHLSRLYQVVSAVEGVARVTVTQFDLHPGTAIQDLIRATPYQWLRLKPENSDIKVIPATQDEMASTLGGTI